MLDGLDGEHWKLKSEKRERKPIQLLDFILPKKRSKQSHAATATTSTANNNNNSNSNNNNNSHTNNEKEIGAKFEILKNENLAVNVVKELIVELKGEENGYKSPSGSAPAPSKLLDLESNKENLDPNLINILNNQISAGGSNSHQSIKKEQVAVTTTAPTTTTTTSLSANSNSDANQDTKTEEKRGKKRKSNLHTALDGAYWAINTLESRRKPIELPPLPPPVNSKPLPEIKEQSSSLSTKTTTKTTKTTLKTPTSPVSPKVKKTKSTTASDKLKSFKRLGNVIKSKIQSVVGGKKETKATTTTKKSQLPTSTKIKDEKKGNEQQENQEPSTSNTSHKVKYEDLTDDEKKKRVGVTFVLSPKKSKEVQKFHYSFLKSDMPPNLLNHDNNNGDNSNNNNNTKNDDDNNTFLPRSLSFTESLNNQDNNEIENEQPLSFSQPAIEQDIAVGVQVFSKFKESVKVFVGSKKCLYNKEWLEKESINSILNVTSEIGLPEHLNDKRFLRIRVSDSIDQPIKNYFQESAQFIEEGLSTTPDGVSGSSTSSGVLIHCKEGRSRSTTMAVVYGMKYLGLTLEQSYNYVASSCPRININSGFLFQLMDFEKKLYGTNSINFFSTRTTRKR